MGVDDMVVKSIILLGRILLEILLWTDEILYLPTILRWPGTVLLSCTVGLDRRADERPLLSEYIVGLIFWLALAAGLYRLLSGVEW